MSGDLLTTVDAAELAERQAGLEGEVPLERLERFIGLLASREGEVSARLSFHRDVVGRLLIDGDCWAEVEVVCQRCLKVMSLTVQGEIHLQVSGRGEPQLADDYETVEQGSNGIVPARLVEDELILSTPLSPRHSDDEVCVATGPAEEGQDAEVDDTHRPFAVLESLKKRH